MSLMMFVLTSASQGQKTLGEKQLHSKYDFYYRNVYKTPMSYQDWLLKKDYVDKSGNLYVSKYKEMRDDVERKNMLPKETNKTIVLKSPGDYLNKASNQLLLGFSCQVLASAGVIAGTSMFSTTADAEDLNYLYIGAGALGLIGLGLEISFVPIVIAIILGLVNLEVNQEDMSVKIVIKDFQLKM